MCRDEGEAQLSRPIFPSNFTFGPPLGIEWNKQNRKKIENSRYIFDNVNWLILLFVGIFETLYKCIILKVRLFLIT